MVVFILFILQVGKMPNTEVGVVTFFEVCLKVITTCYFAMVSF